MCSTWLCFWNDHHAWFDSAVWGMGMAFCFRSPMRFIFVHYITKVCIANACIEPATLLLFPCSFLVIVISIIVKDCLLDSRVYKIHFSLDIWKYAHAVVIFPRSFMYNMLKLKIQCQTPVQTKYYEGWRKAKALLMLSVHLPLLVKWMFIKRACF